MCQSLEFECRECGSNKLAYQKYVKGVAPVTIKDNGHTEYGLSSIDEDDCLAVSNGFCCGNCGCLIEHCGFRFETEQELLDYLTMAPELRNQQQREYEEQLVAVANAQDEQQNAVQDIFDLL